MSEIIEQKREQLNEEIKWCLSDMEFYEGRLADASSDVEIVRTRLETAEQELSKLEENHERN